jgi:uncharacterized protein YjbJ (UPF0337 family)
MTTVPVNTSGAFKITGNWGILSQKIKNKYDELTDEDMEFHTGKEEVLLSKMEAKLHKNREEVIAIIKKG